METADLPDALLNGEPMSKKMSACQFVVGSGGSSLITWVLVHSSTECRIVFDLCTAFVSSEFAQLLALTLAIPHLPPMPEMKCIAPLGKDSESDPNLLDMDTLFGNLDKSLAAQDGTRMTRMQFALMKVHEPRFACGVRSTLQITDNPTSWNLTFFF